MSETRRSDTSLIHRIPRWLARARAQTLATECARLQETCAYWERVNDDAARALAPLNMLLNAFKTGKPLKWTGHVLVIDEPDGGIVEMVLDADDFAALTRFVVGGHGPRVSATEGPAS